MEENKQAPINWGREILDFLKMLLISIVVVFLSGRCGSTAIPCIRRCTTTRSGFPIF